MRLNGSQIRRLVKGFLDGFTDKAAIEEWLRDEMDKELEDIVALSNRKTMVGKLIKVAETENWLLPMLEKLAAQKSYIPEFAEVLAEIKPRTAAPGFNHYNVTVMRRNMALINRTALRDAVRDLNSDPGYRVLVVDGPPLSGKTHSAHFITYLSEALSSFQVVWLDLQRVPLLSEDRRLSPMDLGREIAEQMEIYGKAESDGLFDKQAEQDARWARRFSNWLRGALHNMDGDWWLVIDGFNSAVLSQQARDLIEELAISTHFRILDLRIVLLGYSDPMPTSLQSCYHKEDLGTIGTEELLRFFVQVYEERKARGSREYTEVDVAGAVAQVMRKVDMANARSLSMLSRAVIEVANAINE